MPLRRLLALTVLALCLAASPAHAASAPSGMFGLGDWAWPTATTLDRESAHGLKTWRISLSYTSIGGTQGTLNFSGVDTLVQRAAQRGVTPMFVLSGCPKWLCPNGGPPSSSTQVPSWKSYVAAAVARYGSTGSYWSSHPTVPKLPVTYWQVWNEVNGSASWPSPNAAAYASFLSSTSQAIRSTDASAKVVLAGLPRKMDIWLDDYLPQLYAQPGFKASFDVVAVHEYSGAASDVTTTLDVARRAMIAAGDTAKPVWITEMAWATGGPANPVVVTEDQQAANLRASWDSLVACRARWNLQRVYWFGWQDINPPAGSSDSWIYHHGLLRLDGSAKPALAASDEFTSAATLPDGRGTTCSLPGGAVIDTTTPDTTVVSGPPARTAETNPSFQFGASESPVKYQCRFEGQAWVLCAGNTGAWKPSTPLTQGTHTLSVRAYDATGNTDATPATRTFTVDQSPPDTHVDGTWGDVSAPYTATLTLSATEAVSRFECQVDGGAWTTCTSPFSTPLAVGYHTIDVRAVDLAGNVDPTPSGAPWYQVR